MDGENNISEEMKVLKMDGKGIPKLKEGPLMHPPSTGDIFGLSKKMPAPSHFMGMPTPIPYRNTANETGKTISINMDRGNVCLDGIKNELDRIDKYIIQQNELHQDITKLMELFQQNTVQIKTAPLSISMPDKKSNGILQLNKNFRTTVKIRLA